MKHIIIAEDFLRELRNCVNDFKVQAEEGKFDNMSAIELIDLFHRRICTIVCVFEK